MTLGILTRLALVAGALIGLSSCAGESRADVPRTVHHIMLVVGSQSGRIDIAVSITHPSRQAPTVQVAYPAFNCLQGKPIRHYGDWRPLRFSSLSLPGFKGLVRLAHSLGFWSMPSRRKPFPSFLGEADSCLRIGGKTVMAHTQNSVGVPSPTKPWLRRYGMLIATVYAAAGIPECGIECLSQWKLLGPPLRPHH